MEGKQLLKSKEFDLALPYTQLCWASHIISLGFSFHIYKHHWMLKLKHPTRHHDAKCPILK
jgi:hypothetical protein